MKNSEKKQKVSLKNPTKIYWPKEKYTKGDLFNYYQKVAPYILPYLKDRPESLNRHPNGIGAKNFFQKDVDHMPPAWVKTKKIFSPSNGKNINYLVCEDLPTLLYMVNLGCIEINPWNSRLGNLDKPDYMIIDLDPEGVTFDTVVKVAQMVRQVLEAAGAKCYCKTSGATGLHIYVPLGAKYNYVKVRAAAKLIVEAVHKKIPDISSIERHPEKRKRKVYLDYLQNSKGQTLAVAYSIRPRPGAPVATPLKWSEVKKGLRPEKFTIKNIFKRLKRVGNLWQPVLGKGVDLDKVVKAL